MSYSYIIAPQSLEDRLLKAKLHGANVDMGRFADLIDMAYTERYLDDPPMQGAFTQNCGRLSDACGYARDPSAQLRDHWA